MSFEPASEGRPLRERHRDYTRATILQALAEIVSQGDVHAFTVQQVAQRAGVSHRTVYRHFPTREALLVALAEWLDEELGRRGTPILPRSLEELPDAAQRVFALFDDYAPLVRALAATYAATGIRPPTRERRTRAFRDIVDRALPNVPDDERRAFFAVTRVLMNSQAWQVFHDQLGMSGEESGRAVAWAMGVLARELEQRDAEPGDASTPDGGGEASGA